MCKCGLETLDVRTGQCYNDSCGYYNPMLPLEYSHQYSFKYKKQKKYNAGFLSDLRRGGK